VARHKVERKLTHSPRAWSAGVSGEWVSLVVRLLVGPFVSNEQRVFDRARLNLTLILFLLANAAFWVCLVAYVVNRGSSA
jgi:hypothetical protein